MLVQHAQATIDQLNREENVASIQKLVPVIGVGFEAQAGPSRLIAQALFISAIS